MFQTVVYVFLFTLFVAPTVYGQIYPESVAFETSMEAAGQILSSPALPSLDNDAKFSITPLGGTVKIEGVEYTTVTTGTGEENTYAVSGTANGTIAGMTFNYAGKGDLGFFAIGAWSKVTGNIASQSGGSSITMDARNISGESYVGAAGLTYRLVGDAKSKFAMGLFAGPALIKSQTSADIHHSAGVTKTSVNPDFSGVYLGMQFTLRLGEFRVNPYANVLSSLDIECLKPEYSNNLYNVSKYNTCHNGERGVSTVAMIAGAGVNVGYGRFQFGLMTKGGSSSPGLKATPLMLSFRISL